ncbi:GNAT family N-acetyltransferase [Paenibacillus sp. FSL R5-0749]|uniref:GNAT family N-acetyltransferase n=1 Tax=Paenibacillus sp. FSL R5-0749 TaxID=2921657 RepID=UPI00315AAF8B
MITELHTERLFLRKMNVLDAASLFEIWSDPEVTRFMNITPFTDEHQAIAMINILDDLSQENKAIRFSIIAQESNEIIGSCGYNLLDYDNLKAEIGYDIARSHWGKGYATEAISSLLAHAFSTMKLNRIEAKVDPDHVNSIKLLLKLNFTYEGTLRAYERAGETFNDLNMYSKLATDE